jgi:hypothetical protein
MLVNAATIPRSERIEGRANCLASLAVGDLVYLSAAKAGGLYQVRLADPAAPATMPAVGAVVSKDAATLCVVRFHGPLLGVYSGLTPGAKYVVGTDGRPATAGDPNYPSSSEYFQQVGVATDTTELLIHPLNLFMGSEGGGVTDHSALSGLNAGDDHPQYLLRSDIVEDVINKIVTDGGSVLVDGGDVVFDEG